MGFHCYHYHSFILILLLNVHLCFVVKIRVARLDTENLHHVLISEKTVLVEVRFASLYFMIIRLMYPFFVSLSFEGQVISILYEQLFCLYTKFLKEIYVNNILVSFYIKLVKPK